MHLNLQENLAKIMMIAIFVQLDALEPSFSTQRPPIVQHNIWRTPMLSKIFPLGLCCNYDNSACFQTF